MQLITMFPSTISLFSLLLILLDLSSPAEAQSYVPLYHTCDTGANFTANSTYQSNLGRLLLNLTSNGSSSGFLEATEGQVPDQAYGLVLCRGDVNATECRSCLNTARIDAQQYCAYNKASFIWYDFCFLGFSNLRLILSNTDNLNTWYMGNSNNVTQLDRFDHLLGLLLSSTADFTANSSKRFATVEVSNYTSEFPTIYGLMQCTPDMSVSECSRCLREMFEPALPAGLKGKRGGRIVGTSCNMRYEVYSFYQGTPTMKITVPLPANEPAADPTPPPLVAPPPSAASPAVHGEAGG